MKIPSVDHLLGCERPHVRGISTNRLEKQGSLTAASRPKIEVSFGNEVNVAPWTALAIGTLWQ